MRSLHESPMLCPILGPGVFISSSSFPCGCARSLDAFSATPLLQQDCSRRNDSRHEPPQRNTHLPYDSGQTQFVAEPFESAPDKRRACQAKQPGDTGNRPKQQAPRIVSGHFFCAHPHAELRACSKIVWKLDVHAAESGEGSCSLRLHRGAGFTFGEMRGEPSFFFGGNSFYALLRHKSSRAFVCVIVHAEPPCIAPRSASSPRYSRDFTVDTGVLKTPAISSSCISS